MADPTSGNITPGEVGGYLGGALAICMALGKGIAWAINWRDTRAQTRTAKLDAWQNELKEREKLLADKVDQRMDELEHQVGALTVAVDKWRMAFHLVAAELLQRHPQSAALMQAQSILAEAFPVVLTVPADMEETLGKIGRPAA